MINEIKLVPVTETSYPFQSAAKRCRFDEIGYIEDEYFMSGTANVYTEVGSNHEVDVLYPDAPYTTRLLVRRPIDRNRFSGNVVVEILNASAMMDIDRMWVNLWEYMTRNGDIYVGITSKGHTIDTLKRFDSERYEEINWANPLPDREKPEHVMFQWMPQYESGLYWDMQNDLAKLLRTDNEKNPLKDYAPKYLYLAGWSQSGSYMSRTVNSFSYRAENTGDRLLFDGYLEAGADSALAPINAYEIHATDGVLIGNGIRPACGMVMSREPYIAINTESENRGANWGPDSDAPGYKFRGYEIPGTSHDSHYNMIEYYEGYLHDDAKNYGCELKFEGIEGEALDTPYQYIFQAALRNLYVWVREDFPAFIAGKPCKWGYWSKDPSQVSSV